MYWNNPLEQAQYPGPSDIIFKATHSGRHCLFWNPAARFNNISTNQKLADLCAWANGHMRTQGVDAFLTDPRCFYDIANLVKLNMWIQDIRQQGIVKPWLIQDQGNGTFLAGNGDSRLRCLERIPEISTVPAFVSTHVSRAHLYSDLEPVDSFEQFARLCSAEHRQNFLFRLTDADAPYGLYWYEYDSSRTRAVTPGEPEAVSIMTRYFVAHPGLEITPEWFDIPVGWQDYMSNS
jgi:hypothetical protein